MTQKQYQEYLKRSSQMEIESRITVGELLEQLSVYPRDMEITFGSTTDAELLAFQRLKRRGKGLLQIELLELKADLIRWALPSKTKTKRKLTIRTAPRET